MSIDEKDLSTKQYQSKTDARLSGSHEGCGRTCGHQTSSRERAQTIKRFDTAKTSTTLTTEYGRYAFPKTARLRVRREFLAIQKTGKRRQSRHFVVITASAQQHQSRLGITASRRFGKAVTRNRMKRMLREFFRMRQGRITPARDILLIPKSVAKELSFAQIVKELERVLPIA